MKNKKEIPANIDAYLAEYPNDISERLNKIRMIIHSTIPEAVEKISWGMPTFTFKGKLLIQFAAHKAHIGFYPMPETIEAFKDKLTEYKTSKGGIQFPYKKNVPEELIAEIVLFRVKEVSEKIKK